MQFAGYLGLLCAMLASLMAAAWGVIQGYRAKPAAGVNPILEYAQLAATAFMTFSSMIMFWALATKDYSFLYVYEHVDNVLPVFYTLTAFWAGQEGSLLFWAWMVGIFGLLFSISPSYKSLGEETKLFFWCFFMVVQAFFLLLLTCWSNPFMELQPLQPDGRGLNPLLQNPGMIFHPPLLFLGYGGYVIPACLALASAMASEPRSWVKTGANWTLMAWMFLTSGIILGGWWSYMELGWGGYWAWDPVENASLIPWLTGTALMHTGIIEARRGALARTNIFLVCLTLMLCFFGTYVVRSGVIESLHAFGEGGVGRPLLIFICSGLLLTGAVMVLGERGAYRSLSSLSSRQGLLVITAWTFIALGLVVLLGTTWPVVSSLWSAESQGLDARFYNKVCLPLFTLIGLMLAACPWLGWKSGLRDVRGLALAGVVFLVSGVALFFMGITNPLALIAAASGVSVVLGWLATSVLLPGVRNSRMGLGVLAMHVGVGLMVVGVAFSGPYQVSEEAVLTEGQSMEVAGYTVTFDKFEEVANKAMIRAIAFLEVAEDGKSVGSLAPEKRMYRNFPQPFSEVSLITGLGDEIYGVLLGYSDDGKATIKVNVNPLVNWVWIGGTIMCLATFALIRRKVRP